MKIGHIELCVSDPMVSLEFYKNVLGCTVTDIQSKKFIWLKFDETEILLRPSAKITRASNFSESPFNLVIYTDNLAATKQLLESRGLVFDGEDQGCPLFSDPDGHWFQLVEN